MSQTPQSYSVDNDSHTILLIQFSDLVSSRTYIESDNVSKALSSVIQVFESRVRHQYPTLKELLYTFNDLQQFVEELPDISVLVYNKDTGGYFPQNREWIINQLHSLFTNTTPV